MSSFDHLVINDSVEKELSMPSRKSYHYLDIYDSYGE